MYTKGEYLNGTLNLMIEDAGEHVDALKAAGYSAEGDYLIKTFKGDFPNAEKLISNFNRLFSGIFMGGDWETALLFIAKTCSENHITWYLTGSACDAVRGIHVTPHDLDIEIHSKHWNLAAEVFSDYTVEPFISSEGWVRDYFGRIVAHNIQIDMVADHRFDLMNHDYEPYVWNGYTLWLEPFMTRYKTELQRRRTGRIEAFEAFFTEKGIELSK